MSDYAEESTPQLTLKQRYHRAVLTVRRVTIALIAGICIGAYGMYNRVQGEVTHIMNDLVLKGGCAQKDMDHQPKWFPCTDYYAELGIQQHQAELENAALSAINEAELAKQPRRVKAPKEPIPANLFKR